MFKNIPFIIFGFFISTPIFADAVKLSSDSYVLVDYSTMQVLENKNENKIISPASLTKAMTAYIVFDYISNGRLSLDDMVVVSKDAWKASGTRMFIEVDKKVSVSDLLKGVIVQSGNDASIALAEHISGSADSFSDLMNYYAEKLGMVNTKFKNPTGLPVDGHYSTAKDLSILAYRTIKDHPESLDYYNMKDFEFNKIFQKSSNKMLDNDFFDGMKTGFAEGSGYSYMGTAANNNKRLIMVLSGAETSKMRFNDAEILSNQYFDNYNEYKVADKYKIIKEATTSVLGGEVNYVRAAVSNDVTFLLPNNSKPKITIELKMEKSVKAPVVAGQKIGMFIVYINGLEAKVVDVVAVENVGYGSRHKLFFERVNDLMRGGK